MSSNGERHVLVLQGGGALGAYQAGAYEALAESGYMPDWVAGISIGAINGAIIAGNAPENRVARLREFWERVSSGLQGIPFSADDKLRNSFNDASSLLGLIGGVPGFFEPRAFPPVFVAAPDTAEVGYYSTEPLLGTLEELTDRTVLEDGGTRLSVGAVDIETGNFAYFDNRKKLVTLKHVMASGALPPGLPPVKIDGRYYWDGGVVSNAPLQYVLDEPGDADSLCIFQVDLFSARGMLPKTLIDAENRSKEIRFSSRTRLSTDMMRDKVAARHALHRLLEKLPPELRDDPDAKWLARQPRVPDVSVVQLIYWARAYEGHARDYEFSRISVEEHWEQGRKDVMTTLRKAAWRDRHKIPRDGMRTFDLTQDDKVK